jgi:hypothetical protein
MSNTAKRLLEIMNKLASPSKDARKFGNNINSILKIPALTQNQKRFSEEDLVKRVNPYGRPLIPQTKFQSPISLIFKPLQILLEKTSSEHGNGQEEPASQRISRRRNWTTNCPIKTQTQLQIPSNQSSLKMMANITKNLLRNDHKQEMEILAPLNLPEIIFPEIKAAPKIDIQLPISAPLKIQSNPVNQKVQVNGDVEVNHENFKFTEPVKRNVKGDVLKKIKTAQGYQFQKPLGLKGSQGKKGEFFLFNFIVIFKIPI